MYCCLAQARCWCYEVQYLMWFKTAISPGRSVQITSNLECTQRGFVAIDSFCSLVLILPITEILLCKVNAHFPGRFAPIILANCIQFNVWGNYWHKSSGKMYINFTQGYLHNGKLKKLNKSIVTGPLLRTSQIWSNLNAPTERCGVFEP